MEAAKLNVQQDASITVDVAMGVLLTKLDNAINDLENNKILSEEEFWAEIDAE